MRMIPILFLAVCATGCGDSGVPVGGGDLAGGGPGADLASGVSKDLSAMISGDMAYNPPTDAGALMCGATKVCTSSEVCCVTKTDGGFSGSSCTASNACGGGNLPIQCQGPEYCGGKPCCLTIQNRSPSSILCTSAQTDCSPMFDASGSGKTRLCHIDADCTAGAPGTNFPNCCTGMQGGQQQRFCFNMGLASLAGVTCP